MGPGSDRSPLDDRVAVAILIATLTLGIAAGLLRDQDFFLHGDLLDFHLGGYAEIARALEAGELPLLTLASWQAGALAGEYQYGVFSPLLAGLSVLLFGLDLPLHLITAVLVWIHALILAAGAYSLARQRRLAPELALMIALVSSLNGWIVIVGVSWFAALAGFAWLPWFWWALERAVARRSGVRSAAAAGVFLALIITAGFPFVCLMAFLVALSAVARLAVERRPAGVLPVVGAVLVGLALSAPAWLMLLEYSPATMRVQTSRAWTLQTDLAVPLKAWLGTVLPAIRAPWHAPWQPPGDTRTFLLHVGLAPVAILVAALFARRFKLVAELKLDFLFLAVLVALASSPSLGVFRWSYRWLPLVFLQLALLAAGAAGSLARASRSPPRFGGAAWLLVAAASAWAVLDGAGGPVARWLAAGFLTVAALWWISERLGGDGLRRQLPWLAVALTSFLTFGIGLQGFPHHHRRVDPRPSPALDPAVTYLGLYTAEDAGQNPLRFPGQRFYPGNEPMLSGLRFVNGYTPLGPAGTTRAFGFSYLGALLVRDPPPSRPLGPLLRRMAVDGLVAWPGSRELRNIPFGEFEETVAIPGAVVLHRRGEPTPRVQTVRRAFLAPSSEVRRPAALSGLPLLERLGRRAAPTGAVDFGEAEIGTMEEGRHQVRAAVDARGSEAPVLLCFARPWFPGYRASVDGEPAEVLRLDGILPAVEVPAGRRCEVILLYRPASFVAGAVLSALTAAGLLAGLVLAPRRAL